MDFEVIFNDMIDAHCHQKLSDCLSRLSSAAESLFYHFGLLDRDGLGYRLAFHFPWNRSAYLRVDRWSGKFFFVSDPGAHLRDPILSVFEQAERNLTKDGITLLSQNILLHHLARVCYMKNMVLDTRSSKSGFVLQMLEHPERIMVLTCDATHVQVSNSFRL
jgi:hypothetical protein